MQLEVRCEAPANQLGRIASYFYSVSAFALMLLVLAREIFWSSPHTQGGWGPPADLEYLIFTVQFTLAGVGLVSFPILVFLVTSQISRLAAKCAYLGVMCIYFFLLCYLYSPWIPLRQNAGVKIAFGGCVWLSTTVYGFAIFWFLSRPALFRIVVTSLAALLVLVAMFRYIETS